VFDTRLLTGAGVVAAVAETGNFARAAEVLGLTPSGVSRAVGRLEARIGIRLFDRGPRRVSLTEEGKRFHSRIAPLLAGLEEAAASAAGAGTVVSGRLRLSVDPWFARTILAPSIGTFVQRHPLLSVDLLTSNHREEMMAGVDVAIRFGSSPDSSLVAHRLLDSRVLTCASPQYLELHGTPTTPEELEQHQLIMFRDPLTGLPFQWEFARAGALVPVRAAGRVMLDDPSAAVALCVAGGGIFQSLALGLGPHLANGQLVEILTEWSDEHFPLFAYRASRHEPPAKVRAFLEFAREISATAA
jgi:DNA-binding transcriptional LysR family regulator